jgi:NADH-quinone oxidoreductase subunit H
MIETILQFIKDILYDTDKIFALAGAELYRLWDYTPFLPIVLTILIKLVVAAVVSGFVAVNALFIIWLERKVSARMHQRCGPNRVGPFGLFQTVADTVKLLIKEDIVPTAADKAVFTIAPIIVFLSTFAVFLVIPFGKGIIAADLDIGILFVLAITGLAVIGILAGGFASNNKYSLIGGLRSAAQIVSYEIPTVLTILAVVLLAGSMKMGDIVAAQSKVWYIVLQPLGFILFLIASNAELNRTPFDLPEAESELVAGFNTEYSAMKFALFFLAEFTNVFIVGALATTLFLGGWQGPILPPVVWFFLKTYAMVFVLMWWRWTFPRIRVDQLMAFSWKVLLPIALLNLIITALVAKLI